MIDEEFIKRAMDLFEHVDNKKRHNEGQKKYFSTEKGIYAKRKGDFKRRCKKKEQWQELDWEEKQLIGKFYKNCPNGYEVDHIIPVSKGGKHCLSNLQYLTRRENREKWCKTTQYTLSDEATRK